MSKGIVLLAVFFIATEANINELGRMDALAVANAWNTAQVLMLASENLRNPTGTCEANLLPMQRCPSFLLGQMTESEKHENKHKQLSHLKQISYVNAGVASYMIRTFAQVNAIQPSSDNSNEPAAIIKKTPFSHLLIDILDHYVRYLEDNMSKKDLKEKKDKLIKRIDDPNSIQKYNENLDTSASVIDKFMQSEFDVACYYGHVRYINSEETKKELTKVKKAMTGLKYK